VCFTVVLVARAKSILNCSVSFVRQVVFSRLYSSVNMPVRKTSWYEMLSTYSGRYGVWPAAVVDGVVGCLNNTSRADIACALHNAIVLSRSLS
jgi:hypothetical protein